MDVLLRAMGIAFVSLVVIFAVGNSGGFKSLIRVGACILIFSLVALELSRGIDLIRDMYFDIKTENAFLGESLSVMIKALAIALVGRVGADVCKECGESGIAQGIESVSGVVIFTLSLPVITSILEFSSDVLRRGE